MQLYNASLNNGIRNFARRYSNTTSTNYVDADVNASINEYYKEIVNEIIGSMDDWDFQADYAITDLVANQQEYVLPTDIIKIKRIEYTPDGTNWYNVKFFDLSERFNKANDSTTVNNDFNSQNPYADLMDGSFFLYPIPSSSVSNGIKVWYSKNITELSADSSTPVFHEAYHRVLSYGAAKDYLEANLDKTGAANRLIQAEKNYEKLLKKITNYYNSRNQDRKYGVFPVYDNFGYGLD